MSFSPITPVGGAANESATNVTTLSVTYSPTGATDHCAVVILQTVTNYTGVVVKDNLGNVLSIGPTVGFIGAYYQFPVPSGVTTYTATWTTGQQAGMVVEEYSGVQAVNPAFNTNFATGNSGTTSLTLNIKGRQGNFIVCGLGNISGNALTATVGTARQQTPSSLARLLLIDNTGLTFPSLTCTATSTSNAWDAVGLELQTSAMLQNGVLSLGFDNKPDVTALFESDFGSSYSSTTTPFGTGYSIGFGTGITAGLTFGRSLTNGIVGFYLYLTGTGSAGGSNGLILRWYDVSGGNVGQITLQITLGGSPGKLGFYLGTSSGGTLIGSLTPLNTIVANTWYYIEAKVKIGSGTSGAVELRVNGVTLLSTTGVNTQSSTNNTFDQIIFDGAAAGLNTTYFDDMYLTDMTAPAPLNTYLGAVRVYGQAPNANSAVGGRNAWTPTNPTNVNWQNVANIPDNTSEYNFSDTPGQYDMFRFPTSIIPGTVLFLNEWASMETDNTGATTVKLDCYSGGTDAVGSTFEPADSTLQMYNLIATVDPNTGLSWAAIAAAAAELGVNLVAVGGTTNARGLQIFRELVILPAAAIANQPHVFITT